MCASKKGPEDWVVILLSDRRDKLTLCFLWQFFSVASINSSSTAAARVAVGILGARSRIVLRLVLHAGSSWFCVLLIAHVDFLECFAFSSHPKCGSIDLIFGVSVATMDFYLFFVFILNGLCSPNFSLLGKAFWGFPFYVH